MRNSRGFTARATYQKRKSLSLIGSKDSRSIFGGPWMPQQANRLGSYYASDWNAAANAIPNSALVTPTALSTNILRVGRRRFANSEVWQGSSTVIADNAAVGWDGSNDASTVAGAGNWYLQKVGANLVVMPAGDFTIAVSGKRNTGVNQEAAFTADNTATHSPVKTFTGAWQRFSYSFNKAAPWNLNIAFLCSKDGATDANIQIMDLELFPGLVDLGPHAPDSNLYLGATAYSTSPVTAAGVIDATAGGYGYIQLPAQIAMTAGTAMAIISKTADGSGYDGILSSIPSYGQFTAYAGINNIPYNGIDGGTQLDNAAGLWNLKGQGFHAVTNVNDGVTKKLFLDEILLFQTASAPFNQPIDDLFVSIVNTSALPSGLKFSSIHFWKTALTNAEQHTAFTVASRHAQGDGLTMASARVMLFGGDSITGDPGVGKGWPFYYGDGANPKVLGNNLAFAGATLADMVALEAQMIAVIPPIPGSRLFAYSLMIGANGLLTYPGGIVAYAADVGAHMLRMKTGGLVTCLCTNTPQSNPAFNTEIDALAVYYRDPVWRAANGVDHLIDFRADVTYGSDAAGANPLLYPDGEHPSVICSQGLAGIAAPTLDAL